MASTVLLVEDDRDLREAVAEVLRMDGLDTVSVASGSEALAALDLGLRPDLILLDLMLPAMDGETFRAELMRRKALRSVPVLLLSARHDTRETARRLAVPYLTKPFEVGALLEAIRRHVRRPEK